FMSRKAALDGVKVLKEELIRLSKLSLEDGGLSEEESKKRNAELDKTARMIRGEITQGLADMASEMGAISELVKDTNQGFSKMLGLLSNVLGSVVKVKSGIE